MAGTNSELRLLFDPFCGNPGQTRANEENVRIVVLCATCDFLATLVAPHSTLVSGLVNEGFEACELVFLPKEGMIMMKIITARVQIFMF